MPMPTPAPSAFSNRRTPDPYAQTTQRGMSIASSPSSVLSKRLAFFRCCEDAGREGAGGGDKNGNPADGFESAFGGGSSIGPMGEAGAGHRFPFDDDAVDIKERV